VLVLTHFGTAAALPCASQLSNSGQSALGVGKSRLKTRDT
jgi:hypothetical protein